MRKKHPRVGKRRLAEMYFLRKVENADPESVTEDSPLIADEESGGIVKMKGYK
jgi:predicted lipase